MLTDRQLAMLGEMGIRLWRPSVTPAEPDLLVTEPASPVPAGDRPPREPIGRSGRDDVSSRVVEAVPAPVSSLADTASFDPASPRELADPPKADLAFAAPLDAAALSTLDALRSHAQEVLPASLGMSDRAVVHGLGDIGAGWMVVGDQATADDEADGQPFSGKSGQLLQQMLRAVGASVQEPADAPMERRAYATLAVKCRPASDGNPSTAQLDASRPVLLRELELVGPRVVLAMGRHAAAALLGSGEAIGKLRGKVHHPPTLPNVSVVVTYPPSYLLRHGEDKARAWEDLCLARSVLRQRAG